MSSPEPELKSVPLPEPVLSHCPPVYLDRSWGEVGQFIRQFT